MRKESGSIELVVLGLLGALICVLAFPLLTSFSVDESRLIQDKSHVAVLEGQASK